MLPPRSYALAMVEVMQAQSRAAVKVHKQQLREVRAILSANRGTEAS
jgi:hypothetical protein